MLVKSRIDYLVEGDPVETQVLELGALHAVHEHLVDRFDAEEGQREENSQVRVTEDFHVQTELVRYENLQDFLDFCVIKNAHFHVL